jgi:RNA polymerase sigma factor (TIGR02999 family)
MPDNQSALPGGTDTRFAAVYDELKRLARRQLHAVGGGATLCTTELVHEAFLKLGRGKGEWESRAHFFGAAARAMRQVLVDYARRRRAGKRGGGQAPVSLHDVHAAVELQVDEILALDAALTRLDTANPRLGQLVELRYFGGLDLRDVAQVLGVATRTVERDWLKARLFLLEELQPGEIALQ